MSKTKGIILFRSDDLNGAVSEVLLNTVNKHGVEKVVICTLENIDKEIRFFLDTEQYLKYSAVYIVGLKFDKLLAERITEIVAQEEVKFVYRDHHEESLDLSKYMWGRILLRDSLGNPISSAKNLYREFVDSSHPKYIRLSLLIDMANASITGYVPIDDKDGKEMIEELYSLSGSSENFAKSMIEKISSNDAFFNESDILARIEAEKRAAEEEEERLRQMKEKFKRKRDFLW